MTVKINTQIILESNAPVAYDNFFINAVVLKLIELVQRNCTRNCQLSSVDILLVSI